MAVPKIELEPLSKLFVTTLKEGIKKLPVSHQRMVEPVESLNSFRIKDGFGIYGIIPIGGDFSNPITPDSVIQNQDVAMGVIVGMRPIIDHPRPFAYVQYALDILTGLYLENNRPERLVYPVKWEPMDERWVNDEWWYRIIFNCPTDHYEQKFTEQL